MLCECGCGRITPVCTRNFHSQGYKKGEHRKFCHGHNASKGLPIYHEEDRGHDTPCWIWDGAMCPRSGYGIWRRDGITKGAYRHMYEINVGPVPSGLHLDHLCRIRECVNHDHLEPVTCAENAQRGEGSKLNPDAVRWIRDNWKPGSAPEFAERFGVGLSAIYCVMSGRTWSDVK